MSGQKLADLLIDLLWLVGAAVFAWFFLKTFLVIEALAGVVTYGLWRVERSWE